MATYHITEADVRNRLRKLTSVELPDATLQTTPYLPSGDIWIDKILSVNSTSFSALSATDQGLAKIAEIAWVARRVVLSAPLRSSKTGLIETKPISSKDKKELADELLAEINEIYSLAGWQSVPVSATYRGGDDYVPDEDDKTNVSFTDTEEGEHSMWD